MRRVFFQVHLWVGILAGLYILVVCTTGAALVFRIDLQRALHPTLFTPSAPGPLADPAKVMDSVVKAYPDFRLSGIDAPTTARPTYLAYAANSERFLTILLDPVSARLLGELPERSLIRTIQDLHFDLLAGRTGRMVNGIGALLLILMCATGAVVWWPGRPNVWRALTVDFGRSWKRVNWELHGAIGVWTCVFLLMWGITGVYFAFPSEFRSAVNRISVIMQVRTPQSNPRSSRPSSPLSWRSLIDEARRHVPDQYVARVVVPQSETGAFLVLFSARSPTPAGGAELTSVYLDQHSGELLTQPPTQHRSAGDLIMAWVAPLHVGSFGGFGVKVAWLIFGLAPPILFITGFLMWWQRVVKPRWMRTSVRAVQALEP